VFLHLRQVAGSQLEQSLPALKQAQFDRREHDCVRGQLQHGIGCASTQEPALRRLGTGDAVEEASEVDAVLSED
jgi:hypothetical protein